MVLPPVGLTFPHDGTIFRAVPQMMLLDEVDTQNEWFVQIGYDIKLVCESFVSNLEVESIETSHWQGLSPLPT